MFTQNPINGADERMIEASWGLGEVVVAGRVIPDTFRIDRVGRGARAHAGAQEDRDPRRGRRRHRTRRRSRRSCVEQLCLDDDQLAQLDALADAVRGGLRTGARHRVGVRRRAALPAAVPRGDAGRDRRRGRRRRRSTARPVEVIEQVPLFANMSPRDVEGIAAMFKERRFAAGRDGHQGGRRRRRVLRDRVGRGDGHGRRPAGRDARRGRLLRRDRAHRRGRPHRRRSPPTTELVCHGLTYWEFRPLVQHNATIALEPAADPRTPPPHRPGRPSLIRAGAGVLAASRAGRCYNRTTQGGPACRSRSWTESRSPTSWSARASPGC